MLENRVPRKIFGSRMRVATGEQGILLAMLLFRPTPEFNSRPFHPVEFLMEGRPFSEYCNIPIRISLHFFSIIIQSCV
jgi:hypothetical protein